MKIYQLYYIAVPIWPNHRCLKLNAEPEGSTNCDPVTYRAHDRRTFNVARQVNCQILTLDKFSKKWRIKLGILSDMTFLSGLCSNTPDSMWKQWVLQAWNWRLPWAIFVRWWHRTTMDRTSAVVGQSLHVLGILTFFVLSYVVSTLVSSHIIINVLLEVIYIYCVH